MAQCIQFDLLATISSKNVPKKCSTPSLLQVVYFTFPLDSNHPNHTHPTAPGSLRRLQSCDCHLSSHHPFPSRLPCQQQPNQPVTLPTLKSHRTYGAVAKRLRVFRLKKKCCQRGPSFLTCRRKPAKQKVNLVGLWICVKKKNKDVNQRDKYYRKSKYIYMYMYICIYMYNMYICMYIYIVSICKQFQWFWTCSDCHWLLFEHLKMNSWKRGQSLHVFKDSAEDLVADPEKIQTLHRGKNG